MPLIRLPPYLQKIDNNARPAEKESVVGIPMPLAADGMFV
jgi:hypothetical protein